jgi:adenosylcobinamide kinase / adenosylcobinamide-phosphate guanylyltransferase
MLTLVLGGIRSGKSAFAERLAEQSGRPVTYLATGIAVDAEMEARIAAHRRARPDTWACVEEPLAPAAAVGDRVGTLLLDSVDGWLANLMPDAEERPRPAAEEAIVASCAAEVDRLVEVAGEVVAVSSEVGLSLVSMHPAGRAFTDMLGLLNQRLAAAADETYLVVAGIGMRIGTTVPVGDAP